MDKEYDVIIIGAGIAGLIAGNYLAKAGQKVLILEQHYVVGGCCSSFKRKGFTFDAGAHSLGSCRPGGQIDRVLRDLGLIDNIEIKRSEPSDTVIYGDLRVDFSGNIFDITESLSNKFPHESKNITLFFRELNEFDVTSADSFVSYFSRYKTYTFRSMLDVYFRDRQLIGALCVFLGNLGLASHQIAALPAIAMFKEFVLDGGYYVVGGMQIFVDRLAESFINFGGTLSLRNKASQISIKDLSVRGVESERDGFIATATIISTASPKQTFVDLIGQNKLPKNLIHKINSLLPSVSAVVVYLGLNKSPINTQGWGRTLWYSPNSNADEIYGKVFRGDLDDKAEAMLLAFPSHNDSTLAPQEFECLYLFITAPFQTSEFWKINKQKFYESMINRAQEIIPNLKTSIVVSEIATPSTMFRYTYNDGGAMYGLASTPEQYKLNVMPQQCNVKGLYMASHWATVGAGQGGTPMAAFAGRNSAKLVLSRLNALAKL